MRRENRERRIRRDHPRTASLRLLVSGEPSHQRNWKEGAEAEEKVAAVLEKRCGDDVLLLHDRGIPGSRANVDHIAVCPSGVWVIDTKNHAGKVRVQRGLFSEPRLRIGGRDQSKLARGLSRQVELVENLLTRHGFSVDVQGALCFTRAELPLLGSSSFDGFKLLGPRSLARRLSGDGSLGKDSIRNVAEAISRELPPA